MHLDEFAQILKDETEGGGRSRGATEVVEMAAGDFAADFYLAGNGAELTAELTTLGVVERPGAGDPFHDDIEKTIYDGEGVIDIVKNPGIDLVDILGHILAGNRFGQFFGDLAEVCFYLIDPLRDFAVHHGVSDRAAESLDVERFADVIAGAEAEGLSGCFEGFVGGEHDDLDRGIELLQHLEHVDSGMANHADVEHRYINRLGAGVCERLFRAGSQNDVVILLEDNPD